MEAGYLTWEQVDAICPGGLGAEFARRCEADPLPRGFYERVPIFPDDEVTP